MIVSSFLKYNKKLSLNNYIRKILTLQRYNNLFKVGSTPVQ